MADILDPQPTSNAPTTRDGSSPLEPEAVVDPVVGAAGGATIVGGGQAAPVGGVSIADGVRRSVHPDSIRTEAIAWWILTALIGSVLAIAIGIAFIGTGMTLVLVGGSLLWLAIVGGLTAAAVRWPKISYRNTSYVCSSRGLEISRGVIWRLVISVPKSRVQHTDVLDGPILRKFGLARLVIHTAGTEQAIVLLDGLARETAMALRDVLIGGAIDPAGGGPPSAGAAPHQAHDQGGNQARDQAGTQDANQDANQDAAGRDLAASSAVWASERSTRTRGADGV